MDKEEELYIRGLLLLGYKVQWMLMIWKRSSETIGEWININKLKLNPVEKSIIQGIRVNEL